MRSTDASPGILSFLSAEPAPLTGRPTGPFPYLVSTAPVTRRPLSTPPATHSLNRFQKKVLDAMRQGARLLFDVDVGRALLYGFQRGIEQLAELSVRTLSALVRDGLLQVTRREGRLVHYALGPKA